MTFQQFTGKQYLAIDIANNFGHNLDKADWSDRLAWFQQNEHQLMDLLKQAENPALYYAGVQAWYQMLDGQPVNYPISLDATSSGIQLLACVTGDRKAAEHCNVVSTGHRQDAYTNLYEIMVRAVGDTARINRKDTKKAIMTAFYSSVATPERVFGTGSLLQAFYTVLKTECPGAWELNETMLAIWDPKCWEYSWVLPDNFHVLIPVMGIEKANVNFLNKPYEVSYYVNKPIPYGRSLGANFTHSLDGMVVRELTRRCMFNPAQLEEVYKICNNRFKGKRTSEPDDKMLMVLWDHYKDSGFLSARILDHIRYENAGLIDSSVILALLETFPGKPFEIITIHDCFRCLPNYGNDLRMQYNIILSDIAKSEILSFILSQILQKRVQIGKLDKDLWKDIRESNYALT